MASRLVFLSLMIVVVLASVGCWVYHHHKTAHDDDYVSGLCIVTSGRIKEGKAVEVSYKDKRYKLCCAACKSIFEKDPARCVARHNQQVQSQSSLGIALASCGRVDEAIVQYQKALDLEPDLVGALNNLAWLRATCPKAPLRNAAAAIKLAERAAELSGGKSPAVLDTLAAGYAEGGMFAKAQQTARTALTLARQQGDKALAEKLETRLRLYQAGNPYRENN